MIITHKIAGVVVNPVNKDDLSISINHLQTNVLNEPKPHVGFNNLFLAREDVARIMQLLNNAPGITEGVPYDIEISENGKTEIIKMYIDLMDGLSRSNDGIKTSVKMVGSFEWLEDKIDGFTLETMYDETNVQPFTIDGVTYSSYQNFFDRKFIYVPYVMRTTKGAFLAILSLIYVATELSKIIKFISQWAVPLAGIGVVIAVEQLVVEIVFGLVQILAIIVICDNLAKCEIQPVKYHAAMLMSDMLKVVSAKLKLEFKSSVFDTYPYNQIAYLPEKYSTEYEVTATQNNVFGINFSGFKKTGFHKVGYPTSGAHDSSTPTIQKGYLNGTGGDVLRLAKLICNGKIIPPINSNKLVLERRDWKSGNVTFNLPPVRQDWNGYNTDEFVSNIIISFASDMNDSYSMETYYGNKAQLSHSQITKLDQSLVLTKGLNRIDIPCSRGVMKTELSLVEEIHKDLDFVFNKIVGNAAILAINIIITGVNVFIALLNAIIDFFNLIFQVINVIIKIINAIIKIVGGNGTNQINLITLTAHLPPLKYMSFTPFNAITYKDRLGALLLDSDIVNVPKLIMVDTSRSDFTAAGGFSGQKRIAYLHPNNFGVVNAEYLLDNYYFINSFAGNNHMRKTNIFPSLNSETDTNKITVSLKQFVDMSKEETILDNFGEEATINELVWYPHKNGIAEISFSKKGWLRNPQSNDATKRAQEININLQVKKSVPNGK